MVVSFQAAFHLGDNRHTIHQSYDTHKLGIQTPFSQRVRWSVLETKRERKAQREKIQLYQKTTKAPH